MPATGSIEIEWRFGVDDLAAAERALRARAAALGLALAPAGDLDLLDRYFDTAGWSFHRAGHALRVREAGGRAEAALKALGGADGEEAGGPLRRREIAQPLAAAGSAPPFAEGGPVAERVRAVAGRRAPRPLFALRTRRRRFALAATGGAPPLAEAALDDTAVEDAAGARRASLRRVEVELARPEALAGAAPLAAALARTPGFAPAAAPKYEAALAAVGLAPPAPPSAAPIAIGPATPLAAAARAALRRQLALYRWREPAARLGEDDRAVHDMRVAARRFRTALAVFAPALPPDARGLRDGFRRAAAAPGEVRDLEVALARLSAEAAQDASSPLPPAAALLERRLGAARARMLAALDSPRHERLLDAAEALAAGGAAGPEGAEPALRAAPALLRAAWKRYRRRARRLGAGATDAEAHAVRLRAKRLRYAAEFLAAPYGRPAARFAAAARSVQRALGRRQDAAVAAALFGELARDPSLPPVAAAAIGALAARERAEGRAAAVTFAAAERRLRRRWPRYEAALERAAADADAEG